MKSANKDIYVILGIDMETDVGSWTSEYKGVENGTPYLLDLFKKSNIQATFFFTGEVARIYPEIGKRVLKEGHEVGCHSLFHETVGDPLFDIPGVKTLLPEEVKHRLEVATHTVEKSVGKRPVSFRSPRLWGSNSVVLALEELGYLADATYPMYLFEKQLIPYHPSKDNWKEKGDMNLLEIPNFADITKESNVPYKRDRDQWPILRNKDAKFLMEQVNNFIEHVHGKDLPAVVCFYFHPWEFVKLPKSFDSEEGTVIPKYFLIENCGEYALKELKILIELCKSIGGKFITAENMARNFIW